jgi:hypothetical protein
MVEEQLGGGTDWWKDRWGRERFVVGLAGGEIGW